jgi:UDP-N-acetylmuramoyl-L-alanine--D-glutamate ligase
MARLVPDFKGKVLHTDDMQAAVAFALQYTEPEKICLLSTASPSYSIWKNFEEKGDLFQKAIKASSS